MDWEGGWVFASAESTRSGAERESMAPSWLKYADLRRMRWIDDVLSDKLDSLPFRPEITIIGLH